MSCGCYVLRGQIILPVNPDDPSDLRYQCRNCALRDLEPCGCKLGVIDDPDGGGAVIHWLGRPRPVPFPVLGDCEEQQAA